MRRRFVRRDIAEAPIVQALEAAGFMVWRLIKPCDLLVWRADKGWRALEVKTPVTASGNPAKRKDQQKQKDFLELTGTPIVKSAIEALLALGAVP